MCVKVTPSGKMIISKIGKRDLKVHPLSDREKAAQRRFRDAARMASEVLKNPQEREIYEELYEQDFGSAKVKPSLFHYVQREILAALKYYDEVPDNNDSQG